MERTLKILDAIIQICCIVGAVSFALMWWYDKPTSLGAAIWPIIALLWHWDKKRLMRRMDEIIRRI